MTALAAAALLLSGGTAGAASLDSLGRDFAGAARAAGVGRVALGRFEAGPGAAAARGAQLESRLLTALVRDGRITVVERDAVPQLMAERALGESGALEPSGPNGTRLAAAQAMVLARYDVDGAGTRVSARLVTVDSGVVLAAADAVEDEPAGSPRLPAAPRLTMDPVFDPGAGCIDAARRADALVKSVLDLKARYWASSLETGRLVAPQAGAGFSDPSLRAAFEFRFRDWLSRGRVPELSSEEVKRFVAADGEAFALRQNCGL